MSHYTKEDIIRIVEEEDVEFIRLQFVDIFGILKNMAVTAKQLDSILNNRCTFDAAAINGFDTMHVDELVLVPDLDTFTIFPWRPQRGRVARFICDVRHTDGTPFMGDSRYILKQVIEEDAQSVTPMAIKVQLNKLEPNTSFPLPLNIPYWRIKTSVFTNPLFNKLANTQTKQFFLYFKYLDGVELKLKSLLLKILQMDKYGPLYDKRAEVFSVLESESLILVSLTKDEDISEESIKEIQSSLVHRMDVGNDDDFALQCIIDAAQALIDKLKVLTGKDSMIDNLLYDYTNLFQDEVDGLIKLLYKNVFADLYRLVNAIRSDLNKVSGLITEDIAEMRWSEMLCSMRTIWMNYLLTLNVSIHNEVTHGTKYDDVEEFCDIVATEPQSEYETGIIQEATALGFDLNLPGCPKVILEKTKVVAYCKI